MASIACRDDGACVSCSRVSRAAWRSASLVHTGRAPCAVPARRPWAKRRRGGRAGRRGERDLSRGAARGATVETWGCRGNEAAAASALAEVRGRGGGSVTDAPAIPLALATSDGRDSPTREGACDSRARNRRWPHIESQATEEDRRYYRRLRWTDLSRDGNERGGNVTGWGCHLERVRNRRNGISEI